MKTKRGISLVALAITIVVMVILTTISIGQISNVVEETNKNEFVTELTTIEDKVREYYLLMGTLPVETYIQYTANTLEQLHTNSEYKEALESELISNNDTENIFMIVDMNLLQLQTEKRGKTVDGTDMFVVATNTLNVYYLKGEIINNTICFSTAMLVEENSVAAPDTETDLQVELNEELNIIKSTNVWTNEIRLTVVNTLNTGESLQYTIAGNSFKDVAENNVITINKSNMTESEITAFENNKMVTINRLKDETVIQTKNVSISNLDILSPTLGTMTMEDTSSTNSNKVKITLSDMGLSEIKALYYDYNTMLVGDKEIDYYTDRSDVTASDLLRFGKISKNGTIDLAKNIKSIIVVAVDNAGNMSEVSTYTVEDEYLVSE